MSDCTTYFQFPIGALHLDKPIDQIDHDLTKLQLQKISSFCLIDVGNKLLNEDAEKAQEIAEKYQHGLPSKWTRPKIALFAASVTLNIKLNASSEPAYHMDDYNDISRLRFGKTLVRIRTDFFWHVHDNDEIGWRDFAVLSAIYARIGNDQFKSVTYEQINAASLGFSSQKEMLSHTNGVPQILSERKIRYTVDRLETRRWFVSASPNKRNKFYSNRMTQNQLIEALAQRQLDRKRSKPREKTLAILNRLAELEKGKP